MERAASAVFSALENAEKILEDLSNIYNNKILAIRARSARRWLNKLDFHTKISTKIFILTAMKDKTLLSIKIIFFLNKGNNLPKDLLI